MDKKTYRQAAAQMIRLVRCALNGKTPDPEWVKQLDLQTVFEACQSHILTACAAYALESAGIRDSRFTEAKNKAIRKNILLDAERVRLLARLEQEQIRYMPLKGAILKDWYPMLGMRQMSDNDILYDGRYRKQIREIMLGHGFSVAHYGGSNNVDAYHKPPVVSFEMHRSLFQPGRFHVLDSYYEGIWQMVQKDDDSDFGYHLRTEDFYVYLTAHEYKHYCIGGTGVRTLTDTYVFLRRYGDSMDWDYVNTELAKLEITDFERQNRELAVRLFSGRRLTKEQCRLLNYYIFSGTYGSIENHVEIDMGRVAGGSKARYIFYRLFPPMEKVKDYWGFFYRHKWLLPVLWIWRPFHGIFVMRDRLKTEIRLLLKKK